MEKLLAMRRELKAEEAKEAFFRALAEFQAALPVILKDREVMGKDGKRRYRYAPLSQIIAAIKSPMRESGFSFTLDSREEEGTVVAPCTIHHIGGHSETSTFRVPIDPQAYMNAPQKVASAHTYAKRYALCNALGIVTADEDDDATSIVPEDNAPPENFRGPGSPPRQESANKSMRAAPRGSDGLIQLSSEVAAARRKVLDHLHALVAAKIYSNSDAKEVAGKVDRMSTLVPVSAIAELSKLSAKLPKVEQADTAGLDEAATKAWPEAALLDATRATDPSDEPAPEQGELY